MPACRILAHVLVASGLLFAPRVTFAAAHVMRLGHEERPQGALRVTPYTFGLTSAQRAALKAATDVDLTSLFRVEFGAGQAVPENHPGYLGEVPQVVSPFWPLPRSLRDTEAADPALEGQWWVSDLNTRPAWSLATGRGVVIADCDTGLYTSEQDLAPNLLLDHRRDFSDRDAPHAVSDGRFVFHGTAVAAIMVGARDGRGTNGIAYDAKLIPLQNFNYDPNLDDLDKEEATAKCVLHAMSLAEVDIIVVQNQTTTGSAETFAPTREAIALAVKSGVVVVGAAGNASRELTTEVRYDTGSILVGAVRRGGAMANFSNFGRRVVVAAFGENLHTLYGPQGRMDTFGGTTGATAQVAAAVALMLEVNPELSPRVVRQILAETRVTSGENREVGGQLDVLKAVEAAKSASLTRDRTVDRKLRRKVQQILRGEL